MELSKYFVYHRDIRYDNLLRIVPSGAEIPDRRAPGSERATPWRVVDLANCVKHECDVNSHYYNRHGRVVKDVILACEGGFISVPR